MKHDLLIHMYVIYEYIYSFPVNLLYGMELRFGVEQSVHVFLTPGFIYQQRVIAVPVPPVKTGI